MTTSDRERIEEMLLEDPPPSCRAVSRATGYSDWTIRKIARELDGDPRPMKQHRSRPQESTEEVSAVTSWLVFGGVVALFALAIWVRRPLGATARVARVSGYVSTSIRLQKGK